MVATLPRFLCAPGFPQRCSPKIRPRRRGPIRGPSAKPLGGARPQGEPIREGILSTYSAAPLSGLLKADMGSPGIFGVLVLKNNIESWGVL